MREWLRTDLGNRSRQRREIYELCQASEEIPKRLAGFRENGLEIVKILFEFAPVLQGSLDRVCPRVGNVREAAHEPICRIACRLEDARGNWSRALDDRDKLSESRLCCVKGFPLRECLPNC